MASSSNRLATPEASHHSHRGHRKQGHSHRHGSKSPQPGKERSSGERSDKNWTSTRHTRDDEDEFRRAQCLRTSKDGGDTVSDPTLFKSTTPLVPPILSLTLDPRLADSMFTDISCFDVNFQSHISSFRNFYL
nr:hypothetical protein BgiMline_004030 [Biomphalaria glabrata]